MTFCLLCLIWGSTWLAIKIGLEDSPPFLSAGLRFAIASLVLSIIILLKRLSLLYKKKVWACMILTGVILGIGYGAVYWGEQYIPSGLTAILFSTFPLFVVFFSHFTIPDEKLRLRKIAGIGGGLLGVVLIFSDTMTLGMSFSVWGAMALLFSAADLAVSNIVVKRDLTQVNPIVLTAVQMFFGAILLLLFGLIRERTSDFLITRNSIGALVYLSLIGTVIAFAMYYWLMKRIQVTRISLIVLITPVVAVFLGWVLLGEIMNVRMIVGSAVVLGSVALAIR